VPSGLALGAAFALMLATVALFTAATPRPAPAGGLAAVAAIIAATAWLSRVDAALAAAGLGWLMVNGFFVDRYGELGWHGAGDLVRLGVLVGTALVTSALRGQRQLPMRPRMALPRRHFRLTILLVQGGKGGREKHA
jgi:hypothetical protein